MISLFLFLSLFAHEDLDSTTCTYGKEQVVITKGAKGSYSVQTSDMARGQNFPKPKAKDWYDEKNKQLFDTYTFKSEDLNVVVKRPETKGPVKKTIAIWKNKTFQCK